MMTDLLKQQYRKLAARLQRTDCPHTEGRVKAECAECLGAKFESMASMYNEEMRKLRAPDTEGIAKSLLAPRTKSCAEISDFMLRFGVESIATDQVTYVAQLHDGRTIMADSLVKLLDGVAALPEDDQALSLAQ